MGWDIVFYARFPDRQDPAIRFRQVMNALGQRPGFEPLSFFALLDEGDPLRRRIYLENDFQGAERVTTERVEEILGTYSGANIAFLGAWPTRRDGITGGVTVTTFGPQAAPRGRSLPAGIDLTWDLGDWRRYEPGGKGNYPSIADVMNDLAVVVELGAETIWGIDGDKIVSPDHLYSVFHRDPNHYRDDGGPLYPPIAITDECVRVAIEVGEDRSAIETPWGPIVYHKELGWGNLIGFYEALLGAVEFLENEQRDGEKG
jgi:hypothetical protein